MYEDILTLVKFIYIIIQEAHWWFKEYINAMTLVARFKPINTDLCILYKANELGTAIVVAYADDTLAIGDKPELMDTIECIKKEYVTLLTGIQEYFARCTVKRDLTKMNLKISWTQLITKTTQGFNEDIKSIMTFYTLDTPHKCILRIQDIDMKFS